MQLRLTLTAFLLTGLCTVPASAQAAPLGPPAPASPAPRAADADDSAPRPLVGPRRTRERADRHRLGSRAERPERAGVGPQTPGRLRPQTPGRLRPQTPERLRPQAAERLRPQAAERLRRAAEQQGAPHSGAAQQRGLPRVGDLPEHVRERIRAAREAGRDGAPEGLRMLRGRLQRWRDGAGMHGRTEAGAETERGLAPEHSERGERALRGLAPERRRGGSGAPVEDAQGAGQPRGV